MDRKPDFQLLDHTADLGMVVRGKDIRDLFISGAKALAHLMVKYENRRQTQEAQISLQGQDLIDTFIRWLGEILYLFEGEGLIFDDTKDFDLSDSFHLNTVVIAIPFQPDKDEILHEIKAVTYHQATVNQTQNGWEAKVIFDV